MKIFRRQEIAAAVAGVVLAVGGAYMGEGQEVVEERAVKRSCVTRCVSANVLLMCC